MKVSIETGLNEYMHSHHHDTLMLSLIHDNYGAGNVNSNHPRIRYHEPKHPELFDKYLVDEIMVYVSKEVKAYDDELEFVHEKLLGVHRCHVTGINLDYTENYMHH